MALFFAIAFSAFEFKNDNLVPPVLLDNTRMDFGIFKNRFAHGKIFTVGIEKYLIKRHRRANFPWNFFDSQCISRLNPVLFSACCNYSVHIFDPP